MEKRLKFAGFEAAVAVDDQRTATVRDSWVYRRLIRPLRPSRRDAPSNGSAPHALADDTDSLAEALTSGQVLQASWMAQAVYAAAALSLAEELANGPRRVEQLAQSTNTDPDSLGRLLRALTTFGIVKPTDDGYVTTTAGQLLHGEAEGSVKALTIMYGEHWHWRPWGEIVQAIKTGTPAFDSVYGQPFFEYMAEHTDAEQAFNRAMSGSLSGFIDDLAIADHHDFGRYDVIVDVGGGHGGLISTILAAAPHANGILFDRPAAIAEARNRIDPALAKRCELRDGSFFEAVPSGGDLYMLKNIVHDWGDEESIAILKQVRRAMTPSSKLMLVELMVPTDGRPSFAALLDLELMVLVSGRERTREQFDELLSKAGFELTATTPLAAAEMFLIEAVPGGAGQPAR